MHIFDLEGPLFSVLTKVADLFILNILFIIFSLPIVTMGASWTALYTVTLKMSRDREGGIMSSFWAAFKSNFKKSTIIWLIILFFFWMGFFNLRIMGMVEIPFETFFYIISVMMMIFTFLLFLYVFPLLARFENTVKNTIKNAFLLEVAYFPWTMVLVAISLVPTIALLFVPLRYGIVHILWVLFGFAVTAFFNSLIFEYKIFKKLMSAEEWE